MLTSTLPAWLAVVAKTQAASHAEEQELVGYPPVVRRTDVILDPDKTGLAVLALLLWTAAIRADESNPPAACVRFLICE
jgi:hypothetical protein